VKPKDEAFVYSKPDETKANYYSIKEWSLAEEQLQQKQWE